MTKVFLITGFLGAGKTTFLQNLLNQNSHRVGVLINEFGKIDIDGERLKRSDIETIKLTNGSIFCACLKDNFIQSLCQLIDMDLDYIFVESSGLSDPSNMMNILNTIDGIVKSDYSYCASICIADGLYFLDTVDKMVNTERQIKHSNLILVSKSDLISQERKDQILVKIKSINEETNIDFIEHGIYEFEKLDKYDFVTEPEETTNTVDKKPITFRLDLNREFSPELMREFIEMIQDNFFRIKGGFTYNNENYQLDSVGNIVEIKPSNLKLDQIVLLSSKGIKSLSVVSNACKEVLKDGYKLTT